jgi:hypothetical protein
MTDQDKTKIFELIGEATTCWSNLMGAGTFDSTRAKEIGDKIIAILERHTIGAQLDRIEQYLEQGFLAANFQHTENVGKVVASNLVRYPKDINAMALVTKLDNDQRIIEPAMRETNCALWRHIVHKYADGGTLKYFEMEVKTPRKPKLTINVGGQ